MPNRRRILSSRIRPVQDVQKRTNDLSAKDNEIFNLWAKLPAVAVVSSDLERLELDEAL
jgi:hypothetical protein